MISWLSVKNGRIEKENHGICSEGGMSVYFSTNLFDHFINYLVFEGIVKYYNVEFVSILMYLKILKIDLTVLTKSILLFQQYSLNGFRW